MKYTVRENQSIIDVALQVYGNISYMVKLCVENELDINAELVTGSELVVDESISALATLPTTYRLRNLVVTTDGTVEYDTVVAGDEMLEHNIFEHTNTEHN